MRALAVALALALSIIGCREEPPASAPKEAAAKEVEPPPGITVTAERKDLVFSYAAGEEGFKTATAIADIPDGARRAVVVTDLSLTPEQRRSGHYIYIADLRAARADGTYPVAIASRYGFEAKLAGTSSTSPGRGSGEVVVYTTSWCGVCKSAKKLLAALGVRFVEKDIEASKSAAEELAMKARSAGIQPGGVPVIDVGGVLLQGLDEPTLKSALREKGFLK